MYTSVFPFGDESRNVTDKKSCSKYVNKGCLEEIADSDKTAFMPIIIFIRFFVFVNNGVPSIKINLSTYLSIYLPTYLPI